MTHYTTLGVQPTATLEEITAAYRKLSLEHHPDRKGGDAAKMAAVNAAYEVLSDSAARAVYDQQGGGDAFQQKVEDHIRNIFRTAIGAVAHGASIGNIIRESTDQLHPAIEQLKGIVRNDQRQRERLQTLQGRVSHKDGKPTFDALLAEELADLDQHEAQVSEQIRVLEEVRLQIQGYSDKVSVILGLEFPTPKTR